MLKSGKRLSGTQKLQIFARRTIYYEQKLYFNFCNEKGCTFICFLLSCSRSELSKGLLLSVEAYDKVDTLSDYVSWPEINLLIKFPQQEILWSPFENKASVATKKSC